MPSYFVNHVYQEMIKFFSCICEIITWLGFPEGTSGKEPACQYRRHQRHGFDPRVRKIPRRMEWQSTPVFMPGESQGQRSLAGCGPWGRRESDRTEQLTLSLFLH